MKHVLGLIAVLSLPGCATVMEGTGQSVSIASDPSGATCEVTRGGTQLGDVAFTPGSIHIDKSKNDLGVTCKKEGYQTATVAQSPHFVGTTFGNIVLGGLVGAAVDAATGANYQYPDSIHVSLSPLPRAAPVAAARPALQTARATESGS